MSLLYFMVDIAVSLALIVVGVVLVFIAGVSWSWWDEEEENEASRVVGILNGVPLRIADDNRVQAR
jgi:uncharacterized membrane protein